MGCDVKMCMHCPAYLNEAMSPVGNTDWKYRDAAVMALGCIMEGPQPDQLAPYVAEVLSMAKPLYNRHFGTRTSAYNTGCPRFRGSFIYCMCV